MSLVSVLRRRDHLFAPTRLRVLPQEHLPIREFAQARLPLYVVASDQVSGAEVVLSTGLVTEAAPASTAILGVFPAVRLNGRELVDGGVGSNTPVGAAMALGA